MTVSSPFGGTTDQAITVRLGAVEWDIHEWVKNPIAKIAKDLTAHAQVCTMQLVGWLAGGGGGVSSRVKQICGAPQCVSPGVLLELGLSHTLWWGNAL